MATEKILDRAICDPRYGDITKCKVVTNGKPLSEIITFDKRKSALSKKTQGKIDQILREMYLEGKS